MTPPGGGAFSGEKWPGRGEAAGDLASPSSTSRSPSSASSGDLPRAHAALVRAGRTAGQAGGGNPQSRYSGPSVRRPRPPAAGRDPTGRITPTPRRPFIDRLCRQTKKASPTRKTWATLAFPQMPRTRSTTRHSSRRRHLSIGTRHRSRTSIPRRRKRSSRRRRSRNIRTATSRRANRTHRERRMRRSATRQSQTPRSLVGTSNRSSY